LALFDMFGTASKFEQFSVMLTGIEGSADKARKSMAWVQDFAQKTPYELDDVMDAFVKLKAYGIDPMNGSPAALATAPPA
jgi:phage tail tape-measure protein